MNYPFNNYYEMLQNCVASHPNNTAIFVEDGKTSFLELKVKVDRTVAFLQQLGVGYKDKVALVVANSEEFIVAYMAVTAVGAVAVALNTFLKKDEFNFILNDCKAKILFVSECYLKETKGLEETTELEKVIVIGSGEYNAFGEKFLKFSDIYKTLPVSNFKSPTGLNDIAGIVYTSGTTGHPKGAIISYKNVMSNICGAIPHAITLSHKDRFIVYLPMFHSFTLTIMILLPFFKASGIVIVKSVFPFANVLKQVLTKKVTVFLGVPAIYTALAKAKIPWYFKLFNCVRYFICGSAPLALQTIEDFKKTFPKASLLEGYGLSECSPLVSVNRPGKEKVSSVGVPIFGVQVKIVDEEMVELPVGEVGEIIVKGDNVMQGYLNNPSATDATIINGWLRTGDLGKMDHDGYIYIVDRLKDLIISKGQNVYPREIEEIIYKLDEVECCAVVGVKDELEDEEVVAFVQFKEGMSKDANEIKSYLKQRLANFKVPKSVFIAQELPRNATGKVLKRVLKEQIKDKKF